MNWKFVELQRYRADGWPLCPRCDEDELASRLMLNYNGTGPRPTLADCHQYPFYCYRCQWEGKIEPRSDDESSVSTEARQEP